MSEPRIAVIAIGGNAMIADQGHESVQDQFKLIATSMKGVAELIVDGWSVVLTHGNGPQVGFALRRSELSAAELPPLPMDYADADTQGVIGYMFQRALGNELRRRGWRNDVVTVVTQVVVSPDDPAMTDPTKPIGSFLTRSQAEEIASQGEWSVAEDAGRGWRRVVPSPPPCEILELEAIKSLLGAGHVVVACGGGGIPVVRHGDDVEGTWAVIDKDLTASLLARQVGAEALVILTGVDRVALDFGTPTQRWLDRISATDLRAAHAAGQFAPGSMEPKVRAVLEFLEAGGSRAVITDPPHVVEALGASAGTTIV